MKKLIALMLAMAMMLSLTACGGKRKVKTEKEIGKELAEGYSSALSLSECYTITSIKVIDRTTEKNMDYVTVELSATSNFADYVGTYYLEYMYRKQKKAYELHRLERVNAKYYNLAPPPGKDWISEQASEQAASIYVPNFANPTIESISVEDDPDGWVAWCEADGCAYRATIVFHARDEYAHCDYLITTSWALTFAYDDWSLEFINETDRSETYDTVNGVFCGQSEYEDVVGVYTYDVINAYVANGIQYYDKYTYCVQISFEDYLPDYMMFGFSEISSETVGNASILCGDYIPPYVKQISESSGPMSKNEILDILCNIYTPIKSDAQLFFYDGNANQYIVDRGGVIVDRDPNRYVSEEFNRNRRRFGAESPTVIFFNMETVNAEN